ncbi:MAG: alpha/beta hydrolase, partial [Firmicutes bacterium]|nr:alpha/beta hydrolase [Bacillota bacterium]
MKKLWQRLKLHLAEAPQNDTPFWRNVTCGLWLAAAAAAALGILGIPTGLGRVFDLAAGMSLYFLLFPLATKAAAALFSLLRLPGPRVFAASFITTAALAFHVFAGAESGLLFSLVMAAIFSLSGTAAGLLYAFLRAHGIRRSRKAILLLLFLSAASLCFFHPDSPPPARPADGFAGGAEAALNPANPGPYRYSYFTYGSGTDKKRPEFGREASLVSRTVDASAYITDWTPLRTLFWGFDEKKLPLNGRVWMPEGEGPFPLFLIVHGNHTMEDFSDTGYAYLGELLASRGFITVSVDQNFLNYSFWSGIPDENMKLRAWLLLHHLLQIEDFHRQEGNPFSGKVDWNNVAVAGHSRGGQAAAMAADYQKWFAGDKSLARFASFRIKAVAALAPTDAAVDGEKASPRDIYYLVLHGSQDGDVNSFSGDRQYQRVTFSRGSEFFKAYLYIVGANHSQFNTAWGRLDSSLPKGLLLNRKQTMPPDLQQQIAKVYLAAFLETVLHGRQDYLPLFRDWRYGEKWLPQARYLSHFTGGDYQ